MSSECLKSHLPPYTSDILFYRSGAKIRRPAEGASTTVRHPNVLCKPDCMGESKSADCMVCRRVQEIVKNKFAVDDPDVVDSLFNLIKTREAEIKHHCSMKKSKLEAKERELSNLNVQIEAKNRVVENTIDDLESQYEVLDSLKNDLENTDNHSHTAGIQDDTKKRDFTSLTSWTFLPSVLRSYDLRLDSRIFFTILVVLVVILIVTNIYFITKIYNKYVQ